MKNLRPLGRTGIMVTPIGLGCWQFSKQSNMAGKFWPALDDNLIERIVSPKEIHVKENCGAMSFSLSDQDMIRLDKVSSIFK